MKLTTLDILDAIERCRQNISEYEREIDEAYDNLDEYEQDFIKQNLG